MANFNDNNGENDMAITDTTSTYVYAMVRERITWYLNYHFTYQGLVHILDLLTIILPVLNQDQVFSSTAMLNSDAMIIVIDDIS